MTRQGPPYSMRPSSGLREPWSTIDGRIAIYISFELPFLPPRTPHLVDEVDTRLRRKVAEQVHGPVQVEHRRHLTVP